MKVEQACRFRSSEGYGITARSPGFDKAQETALATRFNDAMSPFFYGLGTSILSCTQQDGYGFYSRNTLRTQQTREVIFTHSFVLSAEDFSRLMREVPQRVLAVPATALMDTQTCGENMDLAEFPDPRYGELDAAAIFAKYNLTPARYSRLLMGAYEAMTSNRSLRLFTSAPLEEREQVVRELSYCIIEGLLPVLKGRISFSSGTDIRMNISIMPAGQAVRDGDLIFGVEQDSYTNIRFRDDLSAACFQALGAAEPEQRRQILEKMEQWLCEITDIESGLTLMLICAAYVYTSGGPLTRDLGISMLRSFAKAAGKSIPLKAANALLTGILEDMIEGNMVSTKLLSNVAEWYLMDSSVPFRRAADRALAQASEEVCVALADAVVRLPVSQNVRELIDTLVAGISPDSPELTEEIRDQLIQWIIREDAGELAEFCAALMKAYTPAQTTALARALLEQAQQRPLNNSEITAISRALYLMIKVGGEGVSFTEKDYTALDAHMDEFLGENMTILAANCLYIRTGLQERRPEQVNLLVRQARRNPYFRMELDKILNGGCLDEELTQIWEGYQTKMVFTEDVTGAQVSTECYKHNKFRNPTGPFETKVKELWFAYVREQLSNEIILDDGILRADKLSLNFLKEAERMEVSAQTAQNMQRFVINEFWGHVSYDLIVDSKLKVSFELRDTDVPNAKFKAPLVTACGQMVSKPGPTPELVKLVMYNNLPEEDQEKVRKLMYRMCRRLLIQKGFMSWDLILLSVWLGGEDYDFDLLNDYMVKIEELIEKRRIRVQRNTAADSILLKDSKVVKAVRRGLSQDTDLAAQIQEEIKGRVGGGLFGRKQEPAPMPERRQPGAPGKFASGNKAKMPPQHNPFAEEIPAEPEKKGFLSKFGLKGK